MATAGCDASAPAQVADAAAGAARDGAANVMLDPGTPQVPPTGQAAIELWLQAGHYKGWACEDVISDARGTPPRAGAHGRHRICSNQALVDSITGPYPVGATSVKEMFEPPNDRPSGYAVGMKVLDGLGPDTWYWYERTGRSPTSRPVADGVGAKLCGPDCHLGAPRDQVFIRAR